MQEEIRPFEPRGPFDRVLYALLAIFGPGAAAATSMNPDLLWAAGIMAIWSAVTGFYTLEWVIMAYRRRRARRAR